MDYLSSRLIYIAILIAGAAIGIKRWRRNTPAFKLLTVLIFTVLLFDGGGIITRLLYADVTYITYGIYGPLEIAIYSGIFLCLFKNKKLRWPILIASAAIIIFNTVYDLTRGDRQTVNTLSILLKCYYYILLSLLVFHEYIVYPNESNILKEQTFWFIASILFVHSMVIMYWSCYKLMDPPPQRRTGEAIMIISNWIYYATIAYILNMRPAESLNKADEIG